VASWQQNNRNLFAALRWQTLSLAVVLSLVLGVGAFEVASALVVLITEKRREIGVLLALGGQPRLLRTTLMLAGGGLGVVGVLGGVLLGVAIAALLTALGIPRFPPDIAAIYMVDRIPLHVLPGHLLAVVALGILEVLLASLLPAHRAASRDPVEVLRWV
jgi:lipoprotein-releasing system permease protein